MLIDISSSIVGVLFGLASAALCSAAIARSLHDCTDLARTGDSVALIRCLEPLAKAGDHQAELELGEQYSVVNEPTFNAEKAAIWLRKAAEHGEVDAQVLVGDLYREGNGVPKDLTEAMKWYRTAADRGDQRAQLMLGRMYFKGLGTPVDVTQALLWERKVANEGGPFGVTAELSIGDVYLKGEGIPQDYVEAARWFRRAAEHGADGAYLTLGQIAEKGLGAPPNPFEAYVDYSITLRWVHDQHGPTEVTEMVTKHRDDASAKLTVDQRANADRIVREHRVSAP